MIPAPSVDPTALEPGPDTGLFGESLLATMGLETFLAREHRRALVGDHAAAARLPATIGAQLRAFVRGEEPGREERRPPERVDYLRTIKQLATPIEPEDVEALVGSHKEPGDALELFIPLTRAVAFLNGAAPRRVRTALTGPENIRPSDQEVAKFSRLFAVADDPMVLLRRLRSGPILADEVAALSSIYPALYTEIGARAQDAIADAMTERTGFRLPRAREQALRTLLPELGPGSPGLVRDMQATFAANQAAAEQAPPRKRRAGMAGNSYQTTAQRTESGGE